MTVVWVDVVDWRRMEERERIGWARLLAHVDGFDENACFRFILVGDSLYVWQYVRDGHGRIVADETGEVDEFGPIKEPRSYLLRYDLKTKETT